MKPKGMDQLRAHVPDLNTQRGNLGVGLYVLGWFALVTAYFIFTDHIPTWIIIDSQIVVIALGSLWLSLFFSRKKAYQRKYGALAYRNAFARFGVPGLALILSAVFHTGYMNGPSIPFGEWKIVAVTLGWLMLIVGFLLWARAILTFGFDNLALLYVYFPEEGRMVDSDIYSVVRHPVYAAVLRTIIGLGLLNGNANALAFVLLAPLGLFGWVRLVEEKELIERFGQSYLDYRKRVPAFWPRLKDFGKFFRFVFIGK